MSLKFEWDTAKSEACFRGRGFDFAYISRVFLDPDRSVREDARYDYGEARYILLGKVETRLYCVVYTVRGGSIRIISARKANSREVAIYADHLRNR
ncbi:MAG: BrnT family toxin [Desulfovibrio sp.]|jgi:uncharacterized DUF497 family protein|nr:BrnT family toxin [Desulfovibrio sp.]